MSDRPPRRPASSDTLGDPDTSETRERRRPDEPAPTAGSTADRERGYGPQERPAPARRIDCSPEGPPAGASGGRHR